jgi:LytS/YehU family sensor histidine kinase
VINWVPWLALAPATVIAARRWPLRSAASADLLRHAATAGAIAVVHAITMSISIRLGSRVSAPSVFVFAAALLTWRLAIDVLVYGTIVGVVLAMDGEARANARDRAALRHSAEAARARLAALELQIQPHFLFNTLNTAAMLANTGRAQESAHVITLLSDLLRELVAESPGETIALARELQLVGRYLGIEKIRFGDRFRSSINARPDTLDVQVPRLLLQPVVENAVRHGLSRSATSGVIEVTAVMETPDCLLVTVADDGPGATTIAADGGQGLGLANTRSRLEVQCGPGSSLTLSDRPEGGTLVCLRLPVPT